MKTIRLRAWVVHLRTKFNVSFVFVCVMTGLSLSIIYYKHKRPLDDEVVDALLALHYPNVTKDGGCSNYLKSFAIRENLGVRSVLNEFTTC